MTYIELFVLLPLGAILIVSFGSNSLKVKFMFCVFAISLVIQLIYKQGEF